MRKAPLPAGLFDERNGDPDPVAQEYDEDYGDEENSTRDAACRVRGNLLPKSTKVIANLLAMISLIPL